MIKLVVVIGVPLLMLAFGLGLEIAIFISNITDGSYLLSYLDLRLGV